MAPRVTKTTVRSKRTTPATPAVVIRVHEATGSSRRNWEGAAADALARAKGQVPSPVGVEVVRTWADVKAGKLGLFHATVRIAYRQELKSPPLKKARV